MHRLVKCPLPLNVQLVWLLAVSLLLGMTTASMAQGIASSPTSNGGVTPYIIGKGNQTCEDVGMFKCSSARVNYTSGSFDDDFGDVTGNLNCDDNKIAVTVTTDTFVKWTASSGVGAVIVKGGPDANVYEYDPQRLGDSGLASPPNSSGKPAGLSNLTFCWNPKPKDPPSTEWCSPGYWKNHPKEADIAAKACGIEDLDKDTYKDEFGSAPDRKPNGVKNDAPKDPSLRLVLEKPQWYGGEAANDVADLLSECHPDVDFKMGDERVENSCPLN